MRSVLMAIIFCLSPILSIGQVSFPQVPQPIQSYSFEDHDWGVSPTSTPKKSSYHGETPTSIPGGRVIRTLELKALLDANKDVVVIDVLDSKGRKSIPGAFWMPQGGYGNFYAAEKTKFAEAIDKLTGGEKTRPVVFLCLSSECWLSYNASLHAIDAGYKDVIWYRGGTNAWTGASLDWSQPKAVPW